MTAPGESCVCETKPLTPNAFVSMFTLLSHGSDVTEDIHSTMFWFVKEQTRADEDKSLR